jgi:hypothetical protein
MIRMLGMIGHSPVVIAIFDSHLHFGMIQNDLESPAWDSSNITERVEGFAALSLRM